jgi:hypothetical protein
MEAAINGNIYSELISNYIHHNYSQRGLELYREVNLGKSIIGKNRRIDILVLHPPSDRAFVIECKYQGVSGTTDEKIPYALDDLASMPVPGCLVYAGQGFSDGVMHMLQGNERAAYCLPDPDHLSSNAKTREFDQLLAMNFQWWDIVLKDKQPYTPGTTIL